MSLFCGGVPATLVGMAQHARIGHRFRLTSIAVAVCFVCQLGACPCGCLEHNYWFQMLRLSDDGHHDANSSAGLAWAAQDDHDCSGELRAQFVNTARASEASLDQLRFTYLSFQHLDASPAFLRSFPTLDRGPPGLWHPTTSCSCIDLQVFLL